MANFPDTWWNKRPLIVAHRGASHAAPQNTLAAFRLAADLGADGVELDVHLTADGVPVVIHDATVEATTDGSGQVTALTLAQVKALDAGVRFHASFAGERVPTLEEVLTAVGHRLLINIELKDFSPRDRGLEATVAALVQRLGLTGRVWFSSFNPLALRRVRRYAPDIPAGMLYDNSLPLPLRQRWLAPITPHEALHPHHALVTPALVAQAHRRGLRVATWTVDDPALAERLATWGVDALITNEPERLLAALRPSASGAR